MISKDRRLVTLLSDFGLQDVYVGVMKGVIAQVNPNLVVIDLTHQIPPQNLAVARFSLISAYPYFPKGTVHVAVVDPGVGSARRAIALQIAEGFLVGPDNGLFSGILSQSPAIAAVELTNPQYWNSPRPSVTFHGRDIFAPVAAHLASGVSFEAFGPAIAPESLVQLSVPDCTPTDSGVSGIVQAIDHYGNLITNIPGTYVEEKSWTVEIGERIVPGGRTYSDGSPKELIGLIGSHGWIEIAINGGNAQSHLQQECKGPVKVVFSQVQK
jgi:S-adenosylmethionine hydrolase